MDVLVLADTHLRDGQVDRLPDEVWAAAERADVVLHAGDVVSGELLEALERRAPVHAVLGNNDHGLHDVLPVERVIDLDGLTVALVHDAGARAGRPRRMKRRFPDADLVVYGHSHLPADEEGVDGQRLFNPGSSTQRRRAPARTYGRLVVEAGRLREHHIVALP